MDNGSIKQNTFVILEFNYDLRKLWILTKIPVRQNLQDITEGIINDVFSFPLVTVGRAETQQHV